MFGPRFFGGRYFGRRYFGGGFAPIELVFPTEAGFFVAADGVSRVAPAAAGTRTVAVDAVTRLVAVDAVSRNG
ncbi:hypothetical protein [Mesorhizobium sp. 128a]